MHVMGETFRSDRELDPRISTHRINGSVAAHEDFDELGQALAIPPPNTCRKTLRVRKLAHQAQFTQPASQGIGLATRSGGEVADRMAADMQGWEQLSYLLMEVFKNAWIGIRETGRSTCEATLSDEVGKEPDLA